MSQETGDDPTGPTDSHVLSQVEQDEKGLAEQAGDTTTTTDIGWNQDPEDVDGRIVAGLSNEDLWMLIRRFNKACALYLEEKYILTATSKYTT